MKQESQVNSKLVQYHQQRRNSHLYNLFQCTRNAILNQQQLNVLRNSEESELDRLHNYLEKARCKPYARQLILDKMQQYPITWLHPYLQRDINTTHRLAAIRIIAQYLATQPSTLTYITLQVLVRLVSDPQHQILSQTLDILDGLTCGLQIQQIYFLKRLQLLPQLIALLQPFTGDPQRLTKVLKIIGSLLYMIDQREYEEQIESLYTSVNELIRASACTQVENIYVVLIVQKLIKIYPHRSHNEIVFDYLLPLLYQWLEQPTYEGRRLAYSVFNLIQLCKADLNASIIRLKVMPLIQMTRQLACTPRSHVSVVTLQVLKTKAYRILLTLIEVDTGLMSDILISNSCPLLCQLMEQLKEVNDSREVTLFLIKIVYRACSNLQESLLVNDAKMLAMSVAKRYYIEHQLQDHRDNTVEGDTMQEEL